MFLLSGAGAQTNTLPFTDSFESYLNGQSIDGTNGWYGSGTVTNLSYSYNSASNGYPLTATHTNVLDITGTVTNLIDGSFAQTVWVDVILEADQFWTGPDAPVIAENMNLALYVNTNNNLVIAHAEYGALSNKIWSVFSETNIHTGDWNRVTLQLDYINNYYSARLNGELLTHAAGRTVPGGGSANGPWFSMLNDYAFDGFSASGNGHLDDVSVTTNAPYPAVSVSDVTVTEGDSGTVNADFTISIPATSSIPVQVDYATSNGTATAGSDYTARSGTATIPAGSTQTVVSVLTTGDTDQEGDETFSLTLSHAGNALMGDATGQATIQNDDAAPLLSPAAMLIYEGFDYGNGDNLHGQTGGFGWGSYAWATNWYKNPDSAVTSTGLDMTGLVTSGRAYKHTTNSGKIAATRRFDASLPLDAGDELWFSAIISLTSDTPVNRALALTLSTGDFVPNSNPPVLQTAGSAIGIYVGNSNNAMPTCSARVWENSTSFTDEGAIVNWAKLSRHCIVGKIVWGAANSNHAIYLYDVTDFSTEPTVPFSSITGIAFNQAALNHVAYYVHKNDILDELRVGPTFGSLLDIDRDLMNDQWEVDTFGDIITADINSDWDLDTSKDHEEYYAGTDAKDIDDLLELTDMKTDDATGGLILKWSSEAGRSYSIISRTNLTDTVWNSVATGIPATPPENSHTTTVSSAGCRFFRIEVE